MKPRARGPPEKRNTPKWKKHTPSADDSVLPRWQARYAELRELEYSKCDAIAKIAKEENLHFNTVYRHMTPQVNERQKKYQEGRWQKEKTNFEMRERIVQYKDKYQKLRRNIQDYVVETFSHSEEPLTMEQISDSIRGQVGIALAPATLEGLCQKVEAKTGQPLLNIHPTVPPTYTIASGYKP